MIFVIVIGDWLIDHKVKIKFSLGRVYSRKYVIFYFFSNEIIRLLRSSRPEVFCKIGVLSNSAKFTGLRPATLLKKRL